MKNWKGGSGKKKGFNAIPEGWQGCPPMSTGFIDDRFFVFKTPFRPELNGKLPEEERFSIDRVVGQVRQMNNSRIGLWIDLTNTTRYYDPMDVTSRGILYEKFPSPGHGTTPSKRAVYDFCGLVVQFFKRNKRDYIGVHCTHGLNRTGFLICSYLIRWRGYAAHEAVMEFASHRPPGIYRQNYVNALYKMGHSRIPPPRVSEPSWLLPARGQQPSTSASSSTSQGLPTSIPNPPAAGIITETEMAEVQARLELETISDDEEQEARPNDPPCPSSSGGVIGQKQRDDNTQTIKPFESISDAQLIDPINS